MRDSDYFELVEDITSIYRVEYKRFCTEFEHAFRLTGFIPSLPCWEINNAYIDQANAFLELERGNRKDAKLWAGRSRKHIMIAVYDCLMTSLEFSRELIDYTLGLSEVRASENFDGLKHDAIKMKQRNKRIREIKDVQRYSLPAINKDIKEIKHRHRQLLKALTEMDVYFVRLGKVLGSPQSFRRVVEQFGKLWILSRGI